jgi:flagellar hook-length control protein FliK
MGQARPKSEALSTDSDFQNLLAAAQAFSQGKTAATHASSASHAPSSLPVDTPVGTRGWDGEVGNKVIWMIGRQEQRAELVLNPPQLGRVEVSLSMNANQTNAVFVSANPAVRDALEAAMPRLREILAEAGINLGQAQVGGDASSNGAANQSTNQRESWDNSRRAMNRLDSANPLESLRPLASPQWLKQSNGLVDVFA